MERETFSRVQAKLRERSKGKRAPRRNSYVLSGMAHCGHCGRPLSGLSGGTGQHGLRDAAGRVLPGKAASVNLLLRMLDLAYCYR